MLVLTDGRVHEDFGPCEPPSGWSCAGGRSRPGAIDTWMYGWML